MVYCNECVLTSYCFDMRKNGTDGLDCHKFKDRDYNSSSRDVDDDSVSTGSFGDAGSNFTESDRNKRFRDVECLVGG